MLIQSSDLAELELFISSYQLDKESICLVGSASLAYLGIRKNMDIDIIIRSDFRTEKFNCNETINISKKIDVVFSPWSEIYDDDEIIENPLLHKKIEGGFKVVVPELLYQKKCWLNRLKDQDDIKQLSEYARISRDWNWGLIENYLPKRRFQERLLAFFKVRLKLFKDNIYERFFKKNRQGLLSTEGTNFLLSKQYRNGLFNRFDIIVRYMVVQSVMNGNDESFDLYNLMQVRRGNSSFEEPLENFIQLIYSIKENGFDNNSPILVDEEMHLIDGAHRLACALYFEINSIPIKILGHNRKYYFGKKWFKANKFIEEDIESLETLKREIFRKNYMYFEVLLWPPAYPLFDKIEEDISSKYRVLSSVTYKDVADLGTFIKSIYEIDDIESWKVNLKLDVMRDYPSSVRRICIEIEDPCFRKKDSNNRLISQKVEILKKDIRQKYSNEVSNYFHDIIIHVGDNFEHTRESSKIKFDD